jgi:hypothetical protein
MENVKLILQYPKEWLWEEQYSNIKIHTKYMEIFQWQYFEPNIPRPSQHCSNLPDACSYWGANADTDYFLVIAKLKCKIHTERKIGWNNCYKYDIQKLQDPRIIQEYKGRIKEGFRNLEILC